MVVGTGKMTFRLYDCRSLKEKRKLVKAIINRIRNRFNISIAETGHNDRLDWCEIGFAMAGNDRRVINSKLDKVVDMAENMGLAQITDSEMEIISY